MTKQAADENISSFVKSIKPKEGMMYIHINAMGAGEYYGSNKNGDFFPESNLLECFKTFETSPAHVFRHHINKDPAKAIGKVLFSIYNDRMHRVELIAEVSKSLGLDIEDRLSRGEYPSTSMACKTPWDMCSMCGNRAHTRQEYCKHLKFELGRVYPDGKRVMALNVAPLKFFDISIVIKPADVTSSVLGKVAYVDNGELVSSAEMAELEDVGEIKMASHRKLADIIKEIEGQVDAASPELEKIIFKTKDPDDRVINQLKVFNLPDILHVFAELCISPSLDFLSELIARKTLGEAGRNKGKEIAAYIRSEHAQTSEVPNVEFKEPERFNIMAAKLLQPYMDSASLLPQYVEKRASEQGYASFSPYGYEEHVPAPKPEHHYIKTMLTIGGIALLAKLYISSLIEKKLQEGKFNTRFVNDAKIALVKKASDYSMALLLIKYAAASDLKRSVNEHSKNLDSVAKNTAKLLKATDTSFGSKTSKVVRSVRLGATVINKITEGN